MATETPSDIAEGRTGEYVVVARRYRPQVFDQLIGQSHVARGLTSAIETNRVGHAYLFTGARGVGKTSSARILAKCLDCVNGPTATPCNECDICRGISSGGDVDVIEIDGASNRGIDEIRQLRQNVNVRPSRARFKIYIIDEVHMLTKEAFNALLKTLEEPPEHVKFIFCTTEAEKIPITILSRCQRYDFAGIETGSIAERLAQIATAEGVEADRDALDLLARRAAGSMRDSQSLLEQLLAFGKGKITAADVHEMLGTASGARLAGVVQAIVDRDPAAALTRLDEALVEGVDVAQLMDQLLGYLRDCMAAAVGCPADSFLHIAPSEVEVVTAASQSLGLETILAVIGVVEQTLSRMRYSTHGRTLAEMALVRATKLEDLDSIGGVITQLSSGQPLATRAPAAGPAAAATSSPPVATPLQTHAVAQELAPPKKKEPEQLATATAASATVPTPAAASNGHELHPRYTEAEVYDDEEPPTDYGVPQATRQPVPARATEPISDAALTESTNSIELTPAVLPAIWEQALSTLADLTAEQARMASGLAILAPDRLAVEFAPKYNFARQFCQRPDQAPRLQAAVSEAVGRPMTLEFRMSVGGAAEPQPTEPPRRKPPNALRLAEATKHPLVQRAVDLFDARPTRVEEPAT